MSREYVAIARQYAEDVLAGRIPACQWTKLACERQLKDLERVEWKYRFDESRAAHICRFIELLPHIKGEWARRKELITLEPWQIFILTTLFGWVDAEDLRRFKTAYIEVPRKNAKSTLSSGVGLYLLAADEEAGAEVYSAATTRDQAAIVWRDAKRMAEKSPGLRRRFGVDTSAHSIFVEEESAFFKPLSRDQGGNHDGLNIHGAIIDELHAHKTREIYDVIETGTGARSQPLLLSITTAGSNRAGICYEQRGYVLKLLERAREDEEYFGIVYTVDDDYLDQPERLLNDEYLWQMANPNWGVSVKPDDVARLARKAMGTPSARPNFFTKRLDVWVNADSAWMDMVSWDRCADPAAVLEQFRGQRCWAAVDLASKIDVACVAVVVRGEEGKVYGFVWNYLPEDAVEESRNSQYAGWADSGFLRTTPGNVTDYAQIEDDIVEELAEKFELRRLGYDPWQAQYLANRLQDLIDQPDPEHPVLVEYRQTVQNMSEPMKELEAMVVSGNFRHDGNPVLTWMASNVVAHRDKKDNVYPNKEVPENKIDGIVALIMAIGLMMSDNEDAGIGADYELMVL